MLEVFSVAFFFVFLAWPVPLFFIVKCHFQSLTFTVLVHLHSPEKYKSKQKGARRTENISEIKYETNTEKTKLNM